MITIVLNDDDVLVAELIESVLARPDRTEALDYVLSIPEGGPSCACGDDHWSCDYGQDDEDEDTEDEEEEEEEEHLARKLADDMNATDAIAGID